MLNCVWFAALNFFLMYQNLFHHSRLYFFKRYFLFMYYGLSVYDFRPRLTKTISFKKSWYKIFDPDHLTRNVFLWSIYDIGPTVEVNRSTIKVADLRIQHVSLCFQQILKWLSCSLLPGYITSRCIYNIFDPSHQIIFIVSMVHLGCMTKFNQMFKFFFRWSICDLWSITFTFFLVLIYDLWPGSTNSHLYLNVDQSHPFLNILFWWLFYDPDQKILYVICFESF